MIAYSEIQEESLRQGVSVQTIEKDYHLDWYLTALEGSGIFREFAFYGGTAIKKLYIPNHRFSEDLDLISGSRADARTIRLMLDKAAQFLEREANLFYFYKPDEIQVSGTQTRLIIYYRGFSEIGGMKKFLLDLAQGIELLPKPERQKLITVYRDLKDRKSALNALSIEDICADKLALVVGRKRKEPRDLYDLWAVLTSKKINFDAAHFRARFHQMIGSRVEFSIVRSYLLKDADFQTAWEIRLRHQVPNLPDFEVAALELAEKLKPLLK